MHPHTLVVVSLAHSHTHKIYCSGHSAIQNAWVYSVTQYAGQPPHTERK